MRGVKGFTVKTNAENAKRRLAKLAKRAREKQKDRRCGAPTTTETDLRSSQNVAVNSILRTAARKHSTAPIPMATVGVLNRWPKNSSPPRNKTVPARNTIAIKKSRLCQAAYQRGGYREKKCERINNRYGPHSRGF
jgi:hypothetical protein